MPEHFKCNVTELDKIKQSLLETINIAFHIFNSDTIKIKVLREI